MCDLNIQLVRFAMATFLFVVLMGDVAWGKPKAASHKKEHISHLSKDIKTQTTKRVNDKLKMKKPKVVTGVASFYGYESGKRTASGARFNPLGKTAAHRTLPLQSTVKVTNLKNNKSVIVTINDRGPYVKGRIIDLSLGAAKTIGMTGTQKVSIELM